MPRQQFDKSSKYLLREHARGILALAGVTDVRRCHTLQAELVQPRRLPDGLLEVFFRGRKEADHILVEVATYPEKRALKQAMNDLMLSRQQLGRLPELLMLVLCPKGRFRIEGRHEEGSRLGWSRLAGEWKVIELWKLSAADLLAASDVGVVPWVPLASFDGPPEELLERCRERIERDTRGDEQADLLAVSQVFAKLKFPAPELLALLGGREVVVESPLIKELIAEETRAKIVRLLTVRFGSAPADVTRHLESVVKQRKLNQLFDAAIVCPDVEAFREKLLS